MPVYVTERALQFALIDPPGRHLSKPAAAGLTYRCASRFIYIQTLIDTYRGTYIIIYTYRHFKDILI